MLTNSTNINKTNNYLQVVVNPADGAVLDCLHNTWVIVVDRELSNCSAISWREQVHFQWNDDEFRFAIDQHLYLDFDEGRFVLEQHAEFDFL
jgi:hypothetical protein